MPGSNSFSGLGNSPRSVTWPVVGSTVASENSSLPRAHRWCRRRAPAAPWRLRERLSRSPLRSARRSRRARDRLREVGIDRVELLDRCEMVASPCPTSAPSVTSARPMRPLIGDLTVVYSRFSLARETSACARRRRLRPDAACDGRLVLDCDAAPWRQFLDALGLLASCSSTATPLPGPLRLPSVRLRTARDRCGKARRRFTSLPCWKVRSITIPDTRARTSAMRVGAIRPGSSRTNGRARAPGSRH